MPVYEYQVYIIFMILTMAMVGFVVHHSCYKCFATNDTFITVHCNIKQL